MARWFCTVLGRDEQQLWVKTIRVWGKSLARPGVCRYCHCFEFHAIACSLPAHNTEKCPFNHSTLFVEIPALLPSGAGAEFSCYLHLTHNKEIVSESHRGQSCTFDTGEEVPHPECTTACLLELRSLYSIKKEKEPKAMCN